MFYQFFHLVPCVPHVFHVVEHGVNTCVMKHNNPAWAQWLRTHHLSCHQG